MAFADVVFYSIPIFFGLIFLSFGAGMFLLLKNLLNKGKKFKEALAGLRLPEYMKKNLMEKFDGYMPAKIDVMTLVKNLSASKGGVAYFKGPAFANSTFFMYVVPSWKELFKFKSTMKSHSILKISGVNIFDYGNISQYTIVKFSEGFIETFFVNELMTVKLNDKVIGFFDFKDKIVLDARKAQVGSFSIPRFGSLMSIAIGIIEVEFQLKSEVFIGKNKIADIILSPSSLQELKMLKDSATKGEVLDIRLFQNLNLHSKWEAYLILGFAVSELSLIENLTP
ncbi:hypothetical protein HYY71_07010 [Candidatus Woesearchaeota archaeon]|nr:hypothetical protein [Candidatus Woesearchaeota archaeon]